MFKFKCLLWIWFYYPEDLQGILQGNGISDYLIISSLKIMIYISKWCDFYIIKK